MPVAQKLVDAIQYGFSVNVEVLLAGELRRLEEEVSKISIVCGIIENQGEFLHFLHQLNDIFVINDVVGSKIFATTSEGIDL